jgi:transcriptional regulator with XRE-family HTH domain
MDRPSVFNDDMAYAIGSRFKELRLGKGLSIPELIHILEKNYNFVIDKSLLNKIENQKSKIQIHQFLVLSEYFKFDYRELLPTSKLSKPNAEEKFNREYNRNPELKYIMDILLSHSTHLSFINHIKTVIKSTLHLMQSSPSFKSDSVLKAASPQKKKLE